MGYLIRRLFYKETYLGLGVLFLAIAGFTYLTARPSQPVEIDGTESSYIEYSHSNGAYDRNELMLEGDSNTYTLDKTTFHPTLPDEVYKHGKMSIWVDQGSTTIIAIELYDANDQNPVKYTTEHYDNPGSAATDTRNGAVALGILGLGGILVYVLWFGLGRRRLSVSLQAQPAASRMFPPGAGLSEDGRFFWDGTQWRNVSPDGRRRWDGAEWHELTTRDLAVDAPPPPGSS